MLMGALITFLVVILILYLINLLPLDGRAKQIARVVVIILGVISLLKYHRGVLSRCHSGMRCAARRPGIQLSRTALDFRVRSLRSRPGMTKKKPRRMPGLFVCR